MLVPSTTAQVQEPRTLRPSRFNLTTVCPDGSLVLANTYSGACAVIAPKDREEALSLLQPGNESLPENEAVAALAGQGFFVPKGTDELKRVRHLQAHTTSSSTHQHLIIFPTEQCNFRCVYCYETFEQGAMSPETSAAVKRFIRRRLKTLASLQIDWFGGEPLVAFDVIAEIMPEVKRLADEKECLFGSHITTNAYLLTPEVATQLLGWGVNSYQITIDGPKPEHDRRRKLHVLSQVSPCGTEQAAGGPSATPDHSCSGGGTGTFDRIMGNVTTLLERRQLFNVCLRTNYDLDSLPAIAPFVEQLARLVGDDPRVRVDFCPIWADPESVTVSLPLGNQRQKTLTSLLKMAHALGLRTNVPDYLRPGGMVCYAAKANSLVIRSDGRLNKCTVALDTDYNHVGRLLPDGDIELDIDRFAKWTNSGLEMDVTCQNCAVSPTCQGNACPLERFENGRRPCPTVKTFQEEMVPLSVPQARC